MTTEEPKAEVEAPAAEAVPAPAMVEESKAIAAPVAPAAKKAPKNSLDRDIALAQIGKEKNLSFIRAWEDSEKTKVENKAQQKFSTIATWENTKKASIEAQLKQKEEALEKKKAEYGEKLKNKIALIHKQSEEKQAMVVAQQCEETLKAAEMAAKYHATGQIPKKFMGCLG